jgi:heme-degrading monooxygenase HmoA
MMGRATVEDYGTFRKTFDGAEEMRKAAGAIGSAVYQSVDDPNEIVVQVEFPTADAAKAFSTSQGLRDAMQRGGLKEPPRLLIVNAT